MRIAIGQISHETNTFSTVRTTKAAFSVWEWAYGQEIVENHRGVEDYLGGMISKAEEMGVQVLPVFSATANPSGTIAAETYEEMKHDLLTGLREVGSVDAVCLALHGAGVAEGVDDLEGDLLAAVRGEIGRSVPLVVTLDLHGNVTPKMVEHASVLLGVNFYPHTDSAERGREAVEIAQRIVTGQLSPVMSLTRLPLMIPTSTTSLSPARDINLACWEWEKHPGVVDCTFFHGFSHTDSPYVGVSVLVVTDGDASLAKAASEAVARVVWDQRWKFTPDYPSPSEAIQRALRMTGGPIVINETSDNPGGGTPGDGTNLLRAMLMAGLTDACFGTIYDPEVAQAAHQIGVGRWLEADLGGKTDKFHGAPLSIRAYVKTLSDGRFLQSSPMWRGRSVNMGKSARLVVGGVDVVVCSVCSQVLDEQVFLLHGMDVTKYRIVGLKSSQHFRAAYEAIAQEIITADSPGLSTCNLSYFNYQRVTRPIFPLDQLDGPADTRMHTFVNASL
ncbi:MAG: M81 family metallopeptidase [Alicyclobacillus sp.]|nr:M81 family metallopeptidase [Alicyclobacillus sp.]